MNNQFFYIVKNEQKLINCQGIFEKIWVLMFDGSGKGILHIITKNKNCIFYIFCFYQ